MEKPAAKHSTGASTVLRLLVEMVVYAVFVFAYYLVVLHFLLGWFEELFEAHKTLYAVASLGVIIAQAVLLELVTTGLFRLIRGKST